MSSAAAGARWTVPAGTSLPAGGFLLVWADNETDQNSTNNADLHAGFRLSQGGEAIGLFAPDGSLVDSGSFGPQTNDVSQSRWPDGDASVDFMPTPTARWGHARPAGVDNLQMPGSRGGDVPQACQAPTRGSTPVARCCAVNRRWT